MDTINNKELFDILKNNFNIKENNIKNFFKVGSIVSNTPHNSSDNDFVVILDIDDFEMERIIFKDKIRYDFCIYGKQTYQNRLSNKELYFIEHTYYPNSFYLKKEIEYKVNLTKKEIAKVAFEHINHYYNESNIQKSLVKLLIRIGYLEQILEYGIIKDFEFFAKDSEYIYSNSNLVEIKAKYFTILQEKLNKFINMYKECN